MLGKAQQDKTGAASPSKGGKRGGKQVPQPRPSAGACRIISMVAAVVIGSVCHNLVTQSSFIPPYLVIDHEAWGQVERVHPALAEITLLANGTAMGVEAFAEDSEGRLYGTTVDGRIVCLTPPSPQDEDIGGITVGLSNPSRSVDDTAFTQTCINNKDLSKQNICGRPLGLWFAPAKKQDNEDAGDINRGHESTDEQTLYACDAYHGLVRLRGVKSAVRTGKIVKAELVTDRTSDGKRNITLCNTPVVIVDPTTKDTCVYFTDSSSKWRVNQVFYELLEAAGVGALLKWCESTNTTSIVVDNLHFPNGVTLSHDGKSLLFNELHKYRIMRWDLTTQQLSVFRTGMPVITDNIHNTRRGTYWVAGAGRRPTIDILIKRLPWLRALIGAVIPYSMIARIMILTSGMGGGYAAEISSDGDLLRVIYDPTHRAKFTSSVYERDAHLYIGAFVSSIPPYVASVERHDKT